MRLFKRVAGLLHLIIVLQGWTLMPGGPNSEGLACCRDARCFRLSDTNVRVEMLSPRLNGRQQWGGEERRRLPSCQTMFQLRGFMALRLPSGFISSPRFHGATRRTLCIIEWNLKALKRFLSLVCAVDNCGMRSMGHTSGRNLCLCCAENAHSFTLLTT